MIFVVSSFKLLLLFLFLNVLCSLLETHDRQIDKSNPLPLIPRHPDIQEEETSGEKGDPECIYLSICASCGQGLKEDVTVRIPSNINIQIRIISIPISTDRFCMANSTKFMCG